MKAYTKIIPGRKGKACDDHYFETIFTDSRGNRYGIFIVADGLSGSPGAGAYASNNTVNHLGKSIYDAAVKGLEPASLSSLVEEKIKEFDKEMQGRFKTTIDSVVIRNEACYLHHAGDSRVYFIYHGGKVEQVTKDESKIVSELGPDNYIGALKSTNPQQKSLEGVRYIFLATDGLWSRATNEQIIQLLRLAEYGGLELLPMFEGIIAQPREALLRQPEENLKKMLAGKVERLPRKQDELVDLVLSLYPTDEEVRKRVDERLVYDDTTMILVDLEERVGELVQAEQQQRKEAAAERAELRRKVEQSASFQGKYEAEQQAHEKAAETATSLLTELGGVRSSFNQAKGDLVNEREEYKREAKTWREKYERETKDLRGLVSASNEQRQTAELAKQKAEDDLKAVRGEYTNYQSRVNAEKSVLEQRVRTEEQRKYQILESEKREADGQLSRLREVHNSCQRQADARVQEAEDKVRRETKTTYDQQLRVKETAYQSNLATERERASKLEGQVKTLTEESVGKNELIAAQGEKLGAAGKTIKDLEGTVEQLQQDQERRSGGTVAEPFDKLFVKLYRWDNRGGKNG